MIEETTKVRRGIHSKSHDSDTTLTISGGEHEGDLNKNWRVIDVVGRSEFEGVDRIRITDRKSEKIRTLDMEVTVEVLERYVGRSTNTKHGIKSIFTTKAGSDVVRKRLQIIGRVNSSDVARSVAGDGSNSGKINFS